MTAWGFSREGPLPPEQSDDGLSTKKGLHCGRSLESGSFRVIEDRAGLLPIEYEVGRLWAARNGVSVKDDSSNPESLVGREPLPRYNGGAEPSSDSDSVVRGEGTPRHCQKGDQREERDQGKRQLRALEQRLGRGLLVEKPFCVRAQQPYRYNNRRDEQCEPNPSGGPDFIAPRGHGLVPHRNGSGLAPRCLNLAVGLAKSS